MRTENILWESKPSQVINWPKYLFFLAISCCWLFFPTSLLDYEIFSIQIKTFMLFYSLFVLLSAFYLFLKIQTTTYQFTNERIIIFSGVFSRLREEIELYRIKDYQVFTPFYIRIFGYSNILLTSSDRTTSKFIFYAIKNSYDVCNLLRDQVEVMRKNKMVREID